MGGGIPPPGHCILIAGPVTVEIHCDQRLQETIFSMTLGQKSIKRSTYVRLGQSLLNQMNFDQSMASFILVFPKMYLAMQAKLRSSYIKMD